MSGARRAPGTRWAGRDRGQTAIEFVGVTPLILLLLVAIWQCVLIGYTFSLAGNAADAGARAGAGDGGDGACAAAAREDLPGAWAGRAGYGCGSGGGPGMYGATITLNVPVLVPGVLDFPLAVHGRAAAVKEDRP
ncbi:pilus assembly protein [Streptomyces sp. LP05-1]|uniref:Pilus assembly protein n=1 Tax=Streptomyces pyxinae TaxID=2970734 RepID=A0ABT2CAT4_9ACTN|nr:TadE/TadG family type IV pilus assembly protein [Streptomyces sp. LP05-1]MCS0634522.1 pilus assembly protein [Streptomyces sp. LP05-1]